MFEQIKKIIYITSFKSMSQLDLLSSNGSWMSTDLILAAIIQSEQDKSDLRCLVIPDGDWGPRCFQEAKVCARELSMPYPPDTHTQP